MAHALATVFPDVPAEAWEPRRRRHPGVFGEDGVWILPIVCFLVRDGDRLVLVDAGCGPASLPLPRRLGVTGMPLDRLAAMGIRPDEVDTVLLTHLHPDHVGAAMDHENGAGPAFSRGGGRPAGLEVRLGDAWKVACRGRASRAAMRVRPHDPHMCRTIFVGHARPAEKSRWVGRPCGRSRRLFSGHL